uniref:DUF19 domain-containing protein n=1 Tax=Heterorhabditis bacteriophora TaxID=37862 RepID=A0A1I7WBW5_HETBA
MEAWDSNGVDVTLLCSEYIRCRTSLMKQQWRCGEGARKLIGRTCRLETHFNVFKRISQRYETDFTQCITREVATNFRTVNKNSIPANCSSVIPKKNEEIDCLISLNASIKRCETLRECCPVIDKCQSTDTPLLLMLKEKRADVIKGTLQCRSNMSAVLKAQVTA